MRVAIFRPSQHSEETVRRFEENGFRAVNVPMIGISVKDVSVRDADCTVVTSQTSARISVERNLLRGKVIAIGPRTAEIIQRAGRDVTMPSKYDSKTLYNEFRDVLYGKKVNLLRSDKGDPVLYKFSEICDLQEYILYSIEILKGEVQRKIVREILEGKFDAVVFTSSMIVEGFFSNLISETDSSVLGKIPADVHVIAIGPPTAKKLRKYGIDALVPAEYTLDGIMELLKNLSD